jgi:hypothetical protein
MKRCLIVCAVAGLALPAVPASSGAALAKSPQVLCVDKHNDLTYRTTPHACTFHKRHAPFANAFEVITRHDRWHHWGARRAKGRGKAVASMTGPVPVHIKLYRARTRCGHLVYTKARFRYPTFHSGGAFKLDACA